MKARRAAAWLYQVGVAVLLATSLSLSQMFNDDLAQLDSGLTVYDALYRWARDAGAETHNWPAAAQGTEESLHV